MSRTTQDPPARHAVSTPSTDGAAAPEQQTTPDLNCAGTPTNDHAALIDIIKADIIPRLMLVHKPKAAPSAGATAVNPVPPATVEKLVRFSIAEDEALAYQLVERELERGLGLETLLLHLLAPAAERLGELWETDAEDFSAVTIGLWRLHMLLREFAPRLNQREEGADQPLKILLAPEPGEQHTLGLVIVAEFFHRAGWSVSDIPISTRDGLAERIGGEHFDLIGLSVGSDCFVSGLADTIKTLRRRSQNPQLGVIVGGQAFAADRSLVTRVGADALCLDPREAPERALELMAYKSQNPPARMPA